MSFYDTMRHFADSYALVAMLAIFVGLCAWPFRPGAKKRNHEAAALIFEGQDDGE